ncbi:MAG: hypothetical protein WCD18_20345 [Thermosynechococcaceae cyanobacterium]
MEPEAETLAQILHHLQIITDAITQTKPPLGFGPAPKTNQFIFCNRKNVGLWYTLDSNNQPEIIEQQALTGFIRKLEFKPVTRRGQETHKLHCHVEADVHYTLESGHDSLFSKGLLSAIAATAPSDLRQPITIEVQPAENETVLFCNVYANGQRVHTPFDSDTDWRLVSRAAIDAVRVANGEREAPNPSQAA